VDPVDDPRAVIERLTAAQNAHDVEAMLGCFHDEYRSMQPLFPARAFTGVAQVRANWSALLAAIEDFRAELVRAAVDGDTVFAEIHWMGTKADGAPLDERGVFIAGVREGRIAWARLYVDEVHHESPGIDAVVRDMAGTEGS
jgi:ketosteroid isomerase-like protein